MTTNEKCYQIKHKICTHKRDDHLHRQTDVNAWYETLQLESWNVHAMTILTIIQSPNVWCYS